MRGSLLQAAAVLLTLLGAETLSRADEPRSATPLTAESDRDPVFRYTTPYSRHYMRAGLEDVLVLGLGFTQYSLNKEGNSIDWDLKPGWTAIESKLDLTAVTFDNNALYTNWVTHPFAGFFYYSMARSNRLSIPVSLLYAYLSSMLWEYVGELREHVAINDLMVTPLGGAMLAEPLLQLGALLHRGSGPSTLFGWLFAPFKSAHDLFDGLDPEQAQEVDSFGLPLDVWHHVSVGAAAGVTHQQRGLTQSDVRVFAQSRIVAIPGYGGAGTHGGWFDGGNVSEIRLQAGVAESMLFDLDLASHVLPFGYAVQDVRLNDAGKLVGHGFYAGLHLGFEYGVHDFDRDRRKNTNRIALISSGLTMEERVHAGRLVVRARLDALPLFAGVEAYALPERRRDYSDIHLTSILRDKSYYHAYGVTLRPRIEAELGQLDAGVDVRADWFEQITARDVDPGSTDERLDAADMRLGTRAWLGFWPTRHLRVSATGEYTERRGRVVHSLASRSEVSVYGGAEVVF